MWYRLPTLNGQHAGIKMRSKGFEGMVCSVAEVMGAIGDRWGMLIMRDLLLGLSRYEDLRHSTGITNTTLSDRLKMLEENGLIERRLYESRPVRFEYKPTAKGRDIGLIMQAMVQIGDRWRPTGVKRPPLKFVDKQTGRSVKLISVDSETNNPVAAQNIGVQAGSGADDLMVWRLTR
ncbi:winged helix-turn-helix transcriptional regulator [Rhizobium mayense]|uniref:winged helix-turn-helix transcriptional regulator n=1 Tax=Rhizobium mayense TaxID=1312184 RepID=UPI00398C62D0